MDVAKLYDEHHAALFRYLFRLTGDGDLAADAVQEAFARMLARPPRHENRKRGCSQSPPTTSGSCRTGRNAGLPF